MRLNEEGLHKSRGQGHPHINGRSNYWFIVHLFIHHSFIQSFINQICTTYYVPGAGDAKHNLITGLRRSSHTSVFEIKRTREKSST